MFHCQTGAPIIRPQIFKSRERLLSQAVGGESLSSKNFSDKDMQTAHPLRLNASTVVPLY